MRFILFAGLSSIAIATLPQSAIAQDANNNCAFIII